MEEWRPPNEKYPPPKVGEPALFRAARVGDHDAIRKLVGEGADVNGVFDIGLDPGAMPGMATPLMVAAGSGDGATVETVKLLLSLGADARKTTGFGTAAGFACQGLGWNYRPGGDVSRLRVLLEAGSPLALNDRKAARSVGEAAGSGDVDRLAVLIAGGAPVNAVFDRESAAQEQLHATSECQLGAGCSFSAMADAAGLDDEMRKGVADLMRQMQGKMAAAPYSFEIPLMGAAGSGSAACVRLLLDAGAEIGAVDNMGHTAIFYSGSAEAVRELARAGIDVRRRDGYGDDALQHLLSEMGDDAEQRRRLSEVCAALIDAGVELVVPPDARHRLYYAASIENRHAVRWLLEAGHGIAPRAGGATALHAICWHWDYGDARDECTREIVRMLLDAGISPNARDEGGNTPLHEAMAGDGTNLVAAAELLAVGADVNAQNEDGQTPLVYLYESAYDYERVVPFLLEHGANPLIANKRGKNAIDIARQMARGENPDWRTEQWSEKGGPPCGWKTAAEPGDEEFRMLELMERAAERFKN